MTFVKRAALMAAIAIATDSDTLLLDHCGLNTTGDHYMEDANGTDYYTMDEANKVFCNIWLFNATGGGMLDSATYPVLAGDKGSWTCDTAVAAAKDQLQHDCGLGGKSPSGGGGGGGSAIDIALKYFTEDKFNYFFNWMSDKEQRSMHGCQCKNGKACEQSDEWYTYDLFVKGFKAYPEIFKDNNGADATDEDTVVRLLSAFMAQTEQETGSPPNHQSLLCYNVEAVVQDPVTPSTPGIPSYFPNYGTVEVPGKGTVIYCGRGPFQLSYENNYAEFTSYVKSTIGVDFRADPTKVLDDPWYSLSSAFWYFGLHKKGPLFATMPDYMIHPRKIAGQKRDFALQIYMINGIECGPNGAQGGVNYAQAVNRVNAYKAIYNSFTGKTIDDELNLMICGDLPPPEKDMEIVNSEYF